MSVARAGIANRAELLRACACAAESAAYSSTTAASGLSDDDGGSGGARARSEDASLAKRRPVAGYDDSR